MSTLGTSNYAAGGANLEARAALWSHVQRTDPVDWFLDLVEWSGAERVVDVGCGTGRFLAPLARRARSVVGLDFSPAMLGDVTADVPLAAGDVCHLPLATDAVDVALAAWMLYHAPDQRQACTELRRIVRPGGTLVAVTNGAGHTVELQELYAEACEALVGGERQRPRLWSVGFQFDAAADELSRQFPDVALHVRRTVARVPTAEPVVRYLGSVRTLIDDALAPDGATFDDLVPHLHSACERRLAAVGAVEVTGLSGALVCR